MRSNIFGTDQSSIRLQLKKMTRLMGVEETSGEVATAKATPQSSVYAKNTLKVLCIRHGGGSFPLFLASKIPGVMVDIVETDPVVISTSTRAMGFLSYSIMKQLGDLLHPKLTIFDETLWKAVQKRLHLYESDAEQFITDRTNIYDMVFVDAYDGDDVFPHKLWDPDSIFLKALGEWLHPDHGPVADIMDTDHQNRGKIEDPPPKAVGSDGDRFRGKRKQAVLDHLVIQKLNAEGRLEKKEAKKEVGLTKAKVEQKGAEEEAGHELLNAFKGDYHDLQPSKNSQTVHALTSQRLPTGHVLGIATVTVLCYICARVPIT
ncbi:S-adenosyl-L-methionine-dependent methyltransferases superfamily protein [Tanacetum coccineum]